MRNSRSSHRLHVITPLGAALALGLTACGGSSGSAGRATGDPATTVHLKLLQFTPNTLTVKSGTAVEFVNDEVITHTVTTGTYTVGADKFRADEKSDGKLDQTLKGKGDHVAYTFTTPGTYTYFCSIHKAMQGQVVVR